MDVGDCVGQLLAEDWRVAVGLEGATETHGRGWEDRVCGDPGCYTWLDDLCANWSSRRNLRRRMFLEFWLLRADELTISSPAAISASTRHPFLLHLTRPPGQ